MNNFAKPDEAFKLPENALYRSHIEICRMLQLLAKNHSSIHADIGISKMFISHVLFVDLRAEHFVISFCANKSLNSEVLQLSSLKFTANFQDAHVAFEVLNPTEVQFNDQPAMQFPLPDALILYHRRECPRTPIPTEASLRCIADEGGFAPFESRITDISHDGFGGILYSGDIKLEPGALLKACRIIVPGGNDVVADLELRYITSITQSDGTSAHRSGFRFIQRPDEIPVLINYFIQDLDKK
jgi:c-di-GMP-binding flagellar brake protein YcgR